MVSGTGGGLREVSATEDAGVRGVVSGVTGDVVPVSLTRQGVGGNGVRGLKATATVRCRYATVVLSLREVRTVNGSVHLFNCSVAA